MLRAEFPALDFLHGDIVMIHLPFGRHTVGESRARRIGRQLGHLPCKKLIIEPDLIARCDLDGFSELIGIIHCPVLLVGHACNSDRSYSFVKVLQGRYFSLVTTLLYTAKESYHQNGESPLFRLAKMQHITPT